MSSLLVSGVILVEFSRHVRRARVDQRGEHRVRIERALRSGTNDTREDVLTVGARPGPMAPTHFARHDGRANRLLGAPVGGVDRPIKQERPDRRELPRQMAREALHVGTTLGISAKTPRSASTPPARTAEDIGLLHAFGRRVRRRSRRRPSPPVEPLLDDEAASRKRKREGPRLSTIVPRAEERSTRSDRLTGPTLERSAHRGPIHWGCVLNTRPHAHNAALTGA
jgi:hypothetical protein